MACSVRARRENSRVRLLISKMPVFTQSKRGTAMETQSNDIPRRTTMALVKPAKSITMPASANHMPSW